MVGTIHNYFKFVLKKPLSLKDIPYPRKEEKLPEVLSKDEVQAMFKQVKNKKHLAILSLLYGCGMRVGEVINLKIADIDSSRHIINIRQGKGFKDRQVGLDEQLLKILREYFTEFKPREYLFNGQFGLQYTASSINQLLIYYSLKANIKKRIHAHKFRHSYATHLLEAGIDLFLIQKLLGHKKSETTEIYARVSTRLISNIPSPLNQIQL
jgi:site-specific recombinase XerD